MADWDKLTENCNLGFQAFPLPHDATANSPTTWGQRVKAVLIERLAD